MRRLLGTAWPLSSDLKPQRALFKQQRHHDTKITQGSSQDICRFEAVIAAVRIIDPAGSTMMEKTTKDLQGPWTGQKALRPQLDQGSLAQPETASESQPVNRSLPDLHQVGQNPRLDPFACQLQRGNSEQAAPCDLTSNRLRVLTQSAMAAARTFRTCS